MQRLKLLLISVLMFAGTSAYAQKFVNGTVFDVDRNPIPGATVSIKGEQRGVTTDPNGNYMIQVESGEAVLVFSFVGYQTQEITVGNQINISVSLEEEYNEMEEVVVVGYGVQRRASVVGSITTVKPQELQVGTSRSLSNQLAGQLSGIIAVQRSGEPNYDASDVWIRGVSTYAGASTPLILIDGVERDINDIDASEIESFSILKDASASAVYGVRGANGVILITTKRGFIGRPKVNIKVERSIQQPTKIPDFIGAGDYMELLNELYENSSSYSGVKQFTEQQIQYTRQGYDPDLYPDVDWVRAITNKYTNNTRANINVAGGSELLRYSLTGSYFGEMGIMAVDKTLPYNTETRLDRYNLRSNVDINITKTTMMRVNIGGYLQEHTKATAATNDIFKYAFETPPHVHPAVYSDGKIPRRPGRQNPWANSTQSGYRRRGTSKLESQFGLEQNLNMVTDGLKVKAIFAFDNYSYNTVERKKNPNYYDPATARDIEGNLILGQPSAKGDEALSYKKSADFGYRRTYFETSLTYNGTFGSNYLDLLLLYNQRSYDTGETQPFRNQGLAGRVSYSYKRKYIGEFNFGYNGSENFAKGYRFGFFPSFAAGWLLSEEEFMNPYKNTFSKVKFRASIGTAGNDQFKDARRFGYETTLKTDTDGYTWGSGSGTSYKGITEGEIGVHDLTWETVLKTNVGFELGLWNAVDLQVDYFFDHRYNILTASKVIPTHVGLIKPPYKNIGKVDNQGVDISLDINKQINKNVSFNLRGNFTYARNKIKDIDEPVDKRGTYRSEEGKSINALKGLVAERLYTADDFDAAGKLKEGLAVPGFVDEQYLKPGFIKYADLNGDGIIDEEDITYFDKTVDPRIVYGFGGSLRVHSFDFSFFFQGAGQMYRMIGGSDYWMPGSGQGVMGNVFTNYNDRWTEENPSQDVFWPRLDYDNSNHNNQKSSWWIHNMSFLRLRTVEVGYSFKPELVSKIGLKGARVYLSGNNLFCISGFKLWDPELGSNTGLVYPSMKSFMAGISLNF